MLGHTLAEGAILRASKVRRAIRQSTVRSVYMRGFIADALANPDRVGGWGQRCNPGQPASPTNQLRTWLSLQQVSKPYHPLFTSLVYKCGCP